MLAVACKKKKNKHIFCRHDVPFFHKTGAAVIFPAVPVLLSVENMLFKDQVLINWCKEKLYPKSH